MEQLLSPTPEQSAFAVLIIGFLFGLYHAVEADHLAAVSAIVSEHKRVRHVRTEDLRTSQFAALAGLAMLRVNFFLNLLIIAHVLRHAVGTFFLVGLLFAFGYALLLNKFFRFADALLGLGTT